MSGIKQKLFVPIFNKFSWDVRFVSTFKSKFARELDTVKNYLNSFKSWLTSIPTD
jgi:hypothetical protein